MVTLNSIFCWSCSDVLSDLTVFVLSLMSGSCQLDRASNVEIGFECQIFVIVIFLNWGRVLQFGAHSRYYKGALTQKISFLVICTNFRSDFHVSQKKNSKQTFNNKFVIQRSVQMTWIIHWLGIVPFMAPRQRGQVYLPTWLSRFRHSSQKECKQGWIWRGRTIVSKQMAQSESRLEVSSGFPYSINTKK